METHVEWRQSDPPPEGRVSVVIRLTDAEALALVAGGDSTAVGEAIATAITAAVADGTLVLP